MGRKKGSIPWNKGIKYTKKLKKRLNLEGLKKGRGLFKGKKNWWGLGRDNPMNRKEIKKKGHSNPNVKATYFKKGHIPWNKGKKGIHFSPNTKFKEGITTGKNHPSWKGGITPENLRIRGTKKFIEWRRRVFERDDYTCQMCNKKGGKIHTNHIRKFSDYPKLRFSVDNGITLCKFCHLKIITWKEEKWEKLFFILLKQQNKLCESWSQELVR